MRRLPEIKPLARAVRRRLSVVVLATGIAFSVLVGFVGGKHVGTFDWGLWATVGTAFGTTGLAFVTWRLAHSAGQQAEESRRLVELTKAEQIASHTPCVYPFINSEWLEIGRWTGQAIPIRNSGKGVAVNVEGHLHWGPGRTNDTPLVGTTLAGGDHATIRPVRKVDEWEDAYGYLEYGDMMGRRWQTRFHFLVPWVGATLRVEVRSIGAYEKVNALGSYSAGWDPVPGMLLDDVSNDA